MEEGGEEIVSVNVSGSANEMEERIKKLEEIVSKLEHNLEQLNNAFHYFYEMMRRKERGL